MEIFNKRFVHFIWDNELKGKECFIADHINILQDLVEQGGNALLYEVKKSDDANHPFQSNNNGINFAFAYYDPNYSIKKAFNEGKEIQYQLVGGVDWADIDSEEALECRIAEGRTFRIKPAEEEKWIAYLARQKNGLYYLTSCIEDMWEAVQKNYGAKTKLFVGSESEAQHWYKTREKFTKVIEAWEDGKEIQFRVLNNWVPTCNPKWNIGNEYRAKPEEKEETKDKDKMNPIQEKKMRRYNLNLGDWDELKEMAVKMFKGMAVLEERFAEKISEGEFVTQDDWKEMNGLWQTFNYTNDDHQLCKEDLHHLFTDDPDEEFVKIKAEKAKEEKKYRPYKTAEEFVQDFQERFRIKYNPSWSMPMIWVKNKQTDARFLITGIVSSPWNGEYVEVHDGLQYVGDLFDNYTYLDGSPVGMED